ncbi:hypothetical protein HYQ44_018477 [Verticillium longisporum]|nr:hypothetical protein HYQ44_018477 [Verticillium longisporum]
MATPTPGEKLADKAPKPGLPQQGRTPSVFPVATPPVSTPFSHAHVAFSPRGPKSSPQQFKKSPATSATLMGHTNAPLNFDSPSAAAAMGALGIGGGLDLGLDNVSVNGLGGLGGLTGEDDRSKRLDAIIDIIGNAKGRVSEAGLERLSQRTGLNKIWEDHRTPDGKVKKTLVIAGHGLQLDVILDNNIVEGVTLAFPESESSIVAKHVDRAGQILLRDLQLLPDQSPLTKKMDEFAANLERLATLDKLSIFPGLDCQEAVAGIFESLERLYNWELARVKEDPAMAGKPDVLLEKTVQCSRSGRPAMHARDQVGLSLDYWAERRLVPPKTPATETYCANAEQIWSIIVGCRPLDGELYPPIRISEDWISQKVEKTDPVPTDLLEPSNGPLLDWLEPAATVLPPASDNKVVAVEVVQPDGTTQRYPNVKFVATLNPPVIVPQAVCNALYNLSGAQPPPMMLPSYTFDGISFPIVDGQNHDASELRTISCERDVFVLGAPQPRRHENTLFVYKPVYGQTISELPFSHPRQLVAMLPTLRQYAFISRLLARSFGANIAGSGLEKLDKSIITREVMTTSAKFKRFMADKEAKRDSEAEKPLTLDVVLSVHPTAGLSIVFPFRDATANIELQVLANGVVNIVSQNILSDELDAAQDITAGPRRKMKPHDLGRLLEVFEDLCQWAEWIRKNLS